MARSALYRKLQELSSKHANPVTLEEILNIRSPDALHSWGHKYLVSRNPKLGDPMDNKAFEAHLTSTGPYLDVAQESLVHSIVIDEYLRTSVIHMSYFLRPFNTDEAIEQDLIWTLKFTDAQDVSNILIQESIEFIDAAASSRLGEIIRSTHGEVGEDVRGGITLGGY